MRKPSTSWKARSTAAIIALAVGTALGGCGGTSGPMAPDITGHWVGEVLEELATVSFDLHLTANDRGAITGTVDLQEEEQMLSGTVIGFHDHPSVSLIIEVGGGGRALGFRYSGNLVGSDEIRGSIQFGVDSTLPLDLERVGG